MLNAVSEALYDLNRHYDAKTLPQKVLSLIARLIRCDSAACVRIDPATSSFSLLSWPDNTFSALDHDEVARLHVREHPLVAHFLAQRDAKAWTLYDFVPRAKFQHSTLYRTLYRPLGIEFQMVMLIPYPDRAPRALLLNRHLSQFSETDRHLLELMWPHITQAVRRTRAASRQHAVPALGMFASSQGILVLNRAGQVELCTEQARIWLTQYCPEGFSQREIRVLPNPIVGWVTQALADQTLQLRGIADPVEPLNIRRGDQYLTMRLIPDYGRGQHLILMDEFAMNTPPGLLAGLGLTPREAEVIAWVAQGKTNREVGIILEISTRTVQKHLERVFDKLGVETRTAAILKVWQVGRYAALARGSA